MDGGEADSHAEPAGSTRQIRTGAVTFWIGLLFTACVLSVLILLSWRRRVQMTELGSVSEQWLIEHRGYDRHYPER